MMKLNVWYFSLLLCAFSCLATDLPAVESEENLWRTLSPENTLYLDTVDGRVILELTQQFSPEHVKHIKQLVRSGFYDGLAFYRVIDGFVAQAGDVDEKSQNPLVKKTMKAEFEWPIDAKASFTLVQSPDLLADQTGFIDGFAVGRNRKENKEWLISCPGTINLARSTDADSGTTDFAIVIGQAPRHLDRNTTVFGRVVYGMKHLNLIERGNADNGGMIEDVNERSKIIGMSIAADLPTDQQQHIKIERTDTDAFKQKLEDRRKYQNDWYMYKGNGALAICYLRVKVEIGQ